MNHLGNVLNVVTDRKLPVADANDNTKIAYFTADVVSFADYLPFGQIMPNRHASDNTYRYGFQGQERDDELKGDGNSVNFEFRMHDPRLGRFFAVDPLANRFPHNSPYAFSENRLLDAIELEGREAYFIHGTTEAYCLPTGANSKDMKTEDIERVGRVFGNKNGTSKTFSWSGKNNDNARKNAGIALAREIIKNRRKTGDTQPITLIGFSHGGNVAIEAALFLVKHYDIKPEEINIVAINTPEQSEQHLPKDSKINSFSINCYEDNVVDGGSDFGGFDFENGVDIDNVDAEIHYHSQIKDFFHHYGVGTKNVNVWLPKLKGAVKELKAKQQESPKKVNSAKKKSS